MGSSALEYSMSWVSPAWQSLRALHYWWLCLFHIPIICTDTIAGDGAAVAILLPQHPSCNLSDSLPDLAEEAPLLNWTVPPNSGALSPITWQKSKARRWYSSVEYVGLNVRRLDSIYSWLSQSNMGAGRKGLLLSIHLGLNGLLEHNYYLSFRIC